MKKILLAVLCAAFCSLGSVQALTLVTDDEAVLKQQLTDAQIANARLAGKADAHEAKIALLEKEKRDAASRATFAERKVTAERTAKNKAQRAANAANYRLAMMKAPSAKAKYAAKKAKKRRA